jgi:DNA-binding MarR family transcriptional regulator
MANISIMRSSRPAGAPAETRLPTDQLYFDLIELLFFAYRDFVGDPDEVLAKLGFGRAHHRVLHFVNRNPGMKVAELLDVLKITKQSLGRVLKQLIDEGYIVQKEGASDRRQRLLFVSPAGEALALKLAGLQTARIARVIAELGPEAREAARLFLAGMIDAEDREHVLRLIARSDSLANGSPARNGGQ